MSKFLTVDWLISAGLIFALLASLFCGGSTELQMSIASGLIGYLSKGVVAAHTEKKGENG